MLKAPSVTRRSVVCQWRQIVRNRIIVRFRRRHSQHHHHHHSVHQRRHGSSAQKPLTSQNPLYDSVDALLPRRQADPVLFLELLPHSLLRQRIEVRPCANPPNATLELRVRYTLRA